MADTNSPAVGIREFDLKQDLDAVKRIWQEVGWVDEEEEILQLDHFFACGRTLLGTLDNQAECSVHICDGELQLQNTALPLCAVTAVTTSRIARGHAFAQRLTARQLAHGAASGAAVAALGMFDQGFYDKLGFGTGAYDHSFVFDPGTLRVATRARTPVRLSHDDYADIHSAMLRRNRVNGSVSLLPPIIMRAELGFVPKAFGLGYRDGERLTHFVWLEPKGEHGPYRAHWLAYENTEQLMELLSLLKSLADQVYSLRLIEPPEIQLQSLLQRPFRNMDLSEKGTHAAEHESYAWWQFRVLDVPACVSALSGLAREVDFVLDMQDPIEPILREAWQEEETAASKSSDKKLTWQGVAGSYVVHLGERSHAVVGDDPTLPRLRCNVNAFSRLLWCVAPASSLAVTDEFAADTALLQKLDAVLTLPPPRPGWDF